MIIYRRYIAMSLLCCTTHFVVPESSGLGALLQQEQSPSTIISTTPVNSGLASVLSNPTAPNTGSLAPKSSNQSLLLQQFLNKQNNPDYQAAMTILQNSALRSEYQNSMLSIQLFFLQYATQTLHTLSVAQIKKTKPTLFSLLNSFSTTSGVKKSAASSLTSLLDNISSSLNNAASTKPSAKKMQQSLKTLMQQLSTQAAAAPAVKSKNPGLDSLLSAVGSPLSTTKKPAGLAALVHNGQAQTSQTPADGSSGLNTLLTGSQAVGSTVSSTASAPSQSGLSSLLAAQG